MRGEQKRLSQGEPVGLRRLAHDVGVVLVQSWPFRPVLGLVERLGGQLAGKDVAAYRAEADRAQYVRAVANEPDAARLVAEYDRATAPRP